MRKIIFIHLAAFLLTNICFAKIRTIEPKLNEVADVKTALGIATILQLESTVQSIIIGDQSGFKVEYLDKAVTIKPLRWGAKTNLYLVTEKRRFNLRLVSGPQDQADYVLYIKDLEIKKPTTWATLDKLSKSKNLSLKIQKLGITNSGFILIEGTIESQELIKPEFFWIYQDAKSKIIHSLYLSAKMSQKDRPVRFSISLAKSDLDANREIIVEVSAKDKVSIALTKELLWK